MESQIILIIVSVVLVGIGIILFFFRKKYLNTVLEMKYTKTALVKDIIDNYKSISDSLGKGNYSEIIEVKGNCQCNNPIRSDHKHLDCVYYHSKIIREYEERVTVTDSDGSTRTETRRGSETVSDIKNSVPFEVEDSTGRIQVNPEGADIVAKQVYNQFQPGEYTGSFHINIGNIGGRRTIGYRYTEEVISLNHPLYILGESTDRNGVLEIVKPLDKQKKFIVSVKSEEELIKSYTNSATAMLIGSIILPVIGIGILLFSFFSKK